MASLSRNGPPPPETGSLLQKMILLSTLIPLPDHSGEIEISEININKRNIYKWKLISYYLLLPRAPPTPG
jgi:hypothetical protein